MCSSFLCDTKHDAPYAPIPSWNAGMPHMFTPAVFGGLMPPLFSYGFSFPPPFTLSSSHF